MKLTEQVVDIILQFKAKIKKLKNDLYLNLILFWITKACELSVDFLKLDYT